VVPGGRRRVRGDGARDALRRVQERYDAARAELDQWEALYGGEALAKALAYRERVEGDRDAARAEVARLRPVVEAARELLGTDSEGGESAMYEWAHKQLADAVDALGPDAPVEPVAAHVRADPDLPPATERALGNLVRAAAAELDAPACPGDPHCRFGHRCAFHRGEHLAQWETDLHANGGESR
jgi:hypothetical protein